MTGPEFLRADPMPAAGVEVDAALVRRLLQEQHPDLAGLPLRRVTNGWDNVVFRLGEHLAVRVPRRELGVACLRNELAWLPLLAPLLPLPVPTPVRVGVPGAGYPWPWAVCRWVPGEPATVQPPPDPLAAATALAQFQRALHRPAPPGAPGNPVRGIALAGREASLDRTRARFPGLWNAQLARLWEQALAAPGHMGPPLWLHGDPHPGNLVTARTDWGSVELAGVIDFGDVCAGDPATDLAIAWLWLAPAAHGPLREHAEELGPGTWDRARGWAVALAVAIAANSADHPELAGVAQRALARLVAPPGRGHAG